MGGRKKRIGLGLGDGCRFYMLRCWWGGGVLGWRIRRRFGGRGWGWSGRSMGSG